MKRSLKTLAHITSIALALSACGSDDAGPDKKVVNRAPIPDNQFKPAELENTIGNLVDEISQTEAKELKLGVVLKTFSGYWEPVKLGANRAIGELDVSGAVLAPTEDDPDDALDRQLEILQEQREVGFDGLGVAPLQTSVGEEIDAAVDQGIPVVTIDSDLDSKRTLYIGTINYEAGKTAGNTLADLIPEASGRVVILGHNDDTWPDGFARSNGAKDVLEQAGYQVTVLKTTWDANGDETDSEAIKVLLTDSDPPVVGLLSMFSPTYRLGMAAEKAGKTGDDVTIAGFDFDTKTLDYMRSGMIKATHAQRQYYMGYIVPYVLYSLNVLGEAKTLDLLSDHMVDAYRFDAGLDVVHADQIDEYNAFLDSLGIGG